MAGVRRFEDLQAWQKSRELVRFVYRVSATGTMSKDFEFRNQFRGAALSSMSNIAEGFSRKGDREFARFLDIARGSLIEVQSLSYAALDAGHLDERQSRDVYSIAERAISMVAGLTAYLRKPRMAQKESTA
jgi:four helix bundle protein